MEGEVRTETRHILAAPKPLRLPEPSKEHKKSQYNVLLIPNSQYKIKIIPKLFEISVIKTRKFDKEPLFRASNPHINDSIFLEEDKRISEIEENLDFIEETINDV